MLPDNVTVNESIPFETFNGKERPVQCEMYVEPGVSNETKPCDNGWFYDPASGYDSTIVSEVITDDQKQS